MNASYLQIVRTLLVLPLLFCVNAFAQGSGGIGGGKFTEAQMQIFLNDIAEYFDHTESELLFPEVKIWETNHDQKFSEFILSIHPKVVDHPVYGPFGEERDCVSKKVEELRYFECYRANLPDLRPENSSLIYTLLLHEIMVHAGIEKPSLDLPSQYQHSSKIGQSGFVDDQNDQPHFSADHALLTIAQCKSETKKGYHLSLMIGDHSTGNLAETVFSKKTGETKYHASELIGLSPIDRNNFSKGKIYSVNVLYPHLQVIVRGLLYVTFGKKIEGTLTVASISEQNTHLKKSIQLQCH